MERFKSITVRITACMLMIALLVGLVPPVSAASPEPQVSMDDLDYSLEGKTPLGSMITGALSEEAAEQTDGFTGYGNLLLRRCS